MVDDYGIHAYTYTGAYILATNFVASGEYIKVDINTKISTSLNCKFYMYDINKNYLGRESSFTTSHSLLSNTEYIRVELQKTQNTYTYINEKFYILFEVTLSSIDSQQNNHALTAIWELTSYKLTISWSTKSWTDQYPKLKAEITVGDISYMTDDFSNKEFMILPNTKITLYLYNGPIKFYNYYEDFTYPPDDNYLIGSYTKVEFVMPKKDISLTKWDTYGGWW